MSGLEATRNALQSSGGAEPGGPAGAPVIGPDRRVEWIAGIDGGIPIDRPIWKRVTDPPYDADPTGSRDSSPAFDRALEDMPEHHVLYVPAGTYRLDSGIRWRGNNKTLRGAGPDRSRLLLYRGLILMMGGGGSHAGDLQANLSEDAVKGETHVHVAEAPDWIKPGHLYVIDEVDDPSLVRSGGAEGSSHPRDRSPEGHRGLGQIVMVTAVRQNDPSDTQVRFDIPLYAAFRTSQTAQILPAGYDPWQGAPLSGCGVEDLSLEGKHALGWSRGRGPGHMIRMGCCASCWVKNIESYNVPENCHVWGTFSYRLEVRDSYFHHAHGYDGGEAYGVALYHVTSASLVENNIFEHLHCPMMACYGASGNVFGYNYAFEGVASSRQAPSISTHGHHASMNLWEGNHGIKALGDWTHGSASHNTLFRNRILGCEPPGLEDQVAISLEYYNRKWNVAGNVLGTPGFHTVYERANGQPGTPQDRVVYKLGYSVNWDCRQGLPYDDLATLDLLRHGNYDTVTDSTIWDESIANRDLPPSLYLKARPSWFGDLPWPPYGPDASGSLENKIPAQVRRWGR